VSAEERQLIAECLQGRTEAFGDLVRMYQDRLYNAVFRYLDNAEDARDVVQEAFLSAYQALQNFKGDSRFFTWLYRIAMNHAIDLKRKHKVVLRLEVGQDEESQPHDKSELSRPEEIAERSEDVARLQQALTLVSGEHRNVLVLKDIEGMKYEEMAEALGVPIGTIRSRLHRARLELRDVLERMEGTPTEKKGEPGGVSPR
jgi:RNA polymerase sigma-70 factor (ECF subfamily)